MSNRVIGFKYREYTSKKTNQLVKGYELYTVRPINDKNVPCGGYAWFVGYGDNSKPTRPAWVSVEHFESLCKAVNNKVVGCDVDILYNQFGGIEEIRPIVG